MAIRSVLFHVVLISYKPDTPEEKKREIFDRYQTLDEDCGGVKAGIYFWQVMHNLDLRKNVHLVEVALFRDNDALQAFRVHPKHQEFTDILRENANWQVGDMMAPFPRPVSPELMLSFQKWMQPGGDLVDSVVPSSATPPAFADSPRSRHHAPDPHG